MQRTLLMLVLTMIVAPTFAHEIRPAFLRIREIEPSTYDLLWKTPAQGEMRLALNVILPPECVELSPSRMTLVHAAAVERRRTRCDGGVARQTCRN